jgi:hypothetical protein
MRTDHITAWLIKQWLHDHAPDIAHGWDFEPDEQVKVFAARVETILPRVRLIFTSQNILARTAISMWNFQDVALLAGGVPTPLTPRPDEVLYYTDGNAEAVQEARAAGYNACHVDVTNTDSIRQLEGAKSAVATGLFHFLPDEPATKVFHALDQQGIHTIAFSHATPDTDQDAIQQYEKLGIKFFARNHDHVQSVLPPSWKIDYHENMTDYMRHAGEIGAKLSETPRMAMFYKASRVM